MQYHQEAVMKLAATNTNTGVILINTNEVIMTPINPTR